MTAGAYSIPEVQRLVATLVASKPGGRIAELGTSYGEGAKAIARGAAAEDELRHRRDRSRARRAGAAGARRQRGRGAGGRLARSCSPTAARSTSSSPTAASATTARSTCSRPAGSSIKDDLTPGRPVEGDATREVLLLDERVEAIEVLVTPEMACIVAVRRA